jgi:pyrroline-5-carboxylate reductase
MQVGFIGSGNMASALARGWGDPVLCTDSGSGRAAALAAELGIPLDQLAIAAALAQPWTWRVLSGAVDPAQVASNAAAAAVDLPADVLSELETVAEDAATYWSARSARAWS